MVRVKIPFVRLENNFFILRGLSVQNVRLTVPQEKKCDNSGISKFCDDYDPSC